MMWEFLRRFPFRGTATCLGGAWSAALAAGAAAGIDPPARSPEESRQLIHVPAGYRVDLMAGEPEVLDPVAFDWDERGRLWVVEMADYPLGLDGNGQAGGRVRILEDADGDGRYERATLFAEGLNFPTGILTWRGGCLVTAAPDVLLLEDRDGDGRAEAPRKLLTGFLEGNQQLRLNGLRWGMDGWVYCANGGHNPNYTKSTQITSLLTGEQVNLGARDFRFRPDTGEIDPLSGPTQFGRNRDAWGRWFGVQNSFPLWHFLFEDRYLRRNPHVAAPSPRVLLTPANPPVHPASPPEKRFHNFNQSGRYTSACSSMIDLDVVLFGRTPELHAFICEPFHNLVQHLVVEESGATFSARHPEGEKPDFFASEDRWTRPVMVRTGPDGGLWVADMYRYMIEHPQWLPPAGRNELLPHYRAGDDLGRIYRVLPSSARPAPFRRLDTLTGPELAALVGSSNGWMRDKAQMVLYWRGERAAAPMLEKLLHPPTAAPARLQALWTLEGLGALRPEHVIAGLADPTAEVRMGVLQLAEKMRDEAVVARAVELVTDPHAGVRLQLGLALGAWDGAAAARAYGRLAERAGNDPQMQAALISSSVTHLRALAEVARGRPSWLSAALSTALGERQHAIVLSLVEGVLPETADPAVNLPALAAFLRVLRASGTSLEQLAVENGGEPRWTTVRRREQDLLQRLRAQALNQQAPEYDRMQAASILLTDPRENETGVIVLGELMAGSKTGEAPAADYLALLVESRHGRVPELLLRDWSRRTPAQRDPVLDALMGREEWVVQLLERVLAGGEVAPSGFDAQRRARLLKHPSADVRQRAERAFAATASRQKVLEDFQPALSLPGDAQRGRAAFAQACAACHELEGVGRPLGSDLRSVTSHAPDKLLASILDPSANIEPGFTAYFVELANGESLYGVIASETGSSLALRLPDLSVRSLLRSEIVRLESSRASLMPDGLEAALTHQSMADLIAYLRLPK